MALDLSKRTDDEVMLAHNQLRMHPEYFLNNPEYRAAIIQEHGRRFGGSRGSPGQQAPNVDANLDAAAAPIAVEPEVRPKQRTPPVGPESADSMEARGRMPRDGVPAGDGLLPGETLDEYGRKYRAGLASRIDAGIAARRGLPDPGQEAYNAATGVMPRQAAGGDMDTVMIDGVAVPTYRTPGGRVVLDGKGNPMTTIGAERRAKEAAYDAKESARISAEAQENLQKYGSRQLYRYKRDNDGNLLDAAGNIIGPAGGRPVAEKVTEGLSPEELEQQNRLEARRQMESRQVSQNAALANRPGLRSLQQQQAEAVDFIRRRNMMAGGSQNIHSSNVGEWNRLAMMDPAAAQRVMEQNMPINRDRADMAKAHNEQLTALGLRVATGQGFQDLDAAERRMGMQRLQELRGIAGKAKNAAWRDYEQQDVQEALERAGASPEERALIMGELFGGQTPAAATAPAPPVGAAPGDAIPTDVRAWGGMV